MTKKYGKGTEVWVTTDGLKSNAKKHDKGTEVWMTDKLHGNHFEVYTNVATFKTGTRNRISQVDLNHGDSQRNQDCDLRCEAAAAAMITALIWESYECSVGMTEPGSIDKLNVDLNLIDNVMQN
jgi:hypothetical protein